MQAGITPSSFANPAKVGGYSEIQELQQETDLDRSIQIAHILSSYFEHLLTGLKRVMGMNRLSVLNPKRDQSARIGRAGWYQYYAGFSPHFAEEIISTAALPRDAKVLDPWNGAGTTTNAAAKFGYHAVGIDLNPVMGIVAKAKLLSLRQEPSTNLT